MKKEDKKQNIIKVVLIILIIILLLTNCSLIIHLKQGYKKEKTGNVDIFEISCEKDSCEEETKDKENNEEEIYNTTENQINKKTNTVSSSIDTQTGKEIQENEELVIQDKDTIWKSENKLRIFSNPVYRMEEKIAPEDSNEYEFKIRNNTSKRVKYNIVFKEDNKYNINMKYKLKKGNNYIKGNSNTYLKYNELNLENITINNQKEDTYILEWKWVSSDNDTQIAGMENAYSLSIQIEAESIE